ncbi:hypothetical protein C9374_013796 [Naegleria lovaniensis]|uniref:Aspartyl/asparaginy/proline hydroxylase domain-containing protein n=1 Tax=Naegleria lovaniensis TaxID=51637 RepID=A0AA88KCW3_NAELO|nr:uncharacterized protein C9374_013796 [Naegleria lovaniensis]KAG2370840.1 hypothetical protein C9374_013796 [Naegleria lovaniensis]
MSTQEQPHHNDHETLNNDHQNSSKSSQTDLLNEPTEHEKKNNPDNNPITDQTVIQKKIKKLTEIHHDWYDGNDCKCCFRSSCGNEIITSANLHESDETMKKVYNTNRGAYWDWLGMDDMGKKCFYYRNDPFNREEYSNIGLFFDALENNFQIIRDELDNLLKEGEQDFQAWPETICKTKGKWKVYPLGFAFGRDLTNEPSKCPKSVQLLSKLNKEYNVHITTAGFSCLSSSCYIAPHKGYCGYSNHCLRVHMGLRVPTSNHHGCAIRVGNIRHCWKEGVVFAFDDYITHEAYNFTNEDRYILLLDIRFRECEKFKFYQKHSSQTSHPNENEDDNCATAKNQTCVGSLIHNESTKWTGIGSNTPTTTTSTATSTEQKEERTFVTLKAFMTNDIECVNANYTNELKDMLKNVVDKQN